MKINKYNYSQIYLLSRSLCLGTLFSFSFFYVGTNALISFILGTLLGGFFTLVFSYIKLNKKTKFFELLLYIFFIELSFIIITTFISSFFLNKTPKIIIILPSIMLCFYASLKNNDTLKNFALVLTFFSIITIIFNFLSLMHFIDIKNILPLFTFKNNKMIKSVLFYAVITSAPLLLLTDQNISQKDFLISYFITNIISFIICFAIVSILGRHLIKMYSYPEYMVLKKIQISSFIENVENFVSLIWLFDLFYLITFSIKKTSLILKKNYLTYILVIMICIINSFFINSNYEYMLFIYKNVYVILYILIIPIIIFSDKKKNYFIPKK